MTYNRRMLLPDLCGLLGVLLMAAVVLYACH